MQGSVVKQIVDYARKLERELQWHEFRSQDIGNDGFVLAYPEGKIEARVIYRDGEYIALARYNTDDGPRFRVSEGAKEFAKYEAIRCLLIDRLQHIREV